MGNRTNTTLTIAGIAFAATLLSGCGTPASTTVSNTPGQTKKPRIGVSIPAADHGWTAGVGYWAQQAEKLHPEIEWIHETAGTSTEQINDIETMESKGLDGLVILCTESAPLTQTGVDLHNKGVFIVNVDRGFTQPAADVFLEGDNVSFGRKSAEYMADRMKGSGKIVILEGIPSTVNTDRVKAFRDAMAKFPGIQILDSQSGMWNREKSLNVMQAMLAKHPDIDAVWASDDDMALGAEQAIKEAGKQDKIWMLGGAGMKDIVKRVMDGDKMFPADITYPPSMIAAGIEIAAGALAGGNADKKKQYLPRHMKIDVDLITPENAKDYYFPDSIF
jgi:ribose transport system substrate-binding protein